MSVDRRRLTLLVAGVIGVALLSTFLLIHPIPGWPGIECDATIGLVSDAPNPVVEDSNGHTVIPTSVQLVNPSGSVVATSRSWSAPPAGWHAGDHYVVRYDTGPGVYRLVKRGGGPQGALLGYPAQDEVVQQIIVLPGFHSAISTEQCT